MAKTAQLDLPLVMPAQAQKHVTVNEALARLDAAAQLRVASSTLQDPPASADEGRSYLVPADASGAWQGMVGRIAVWSNGGWIFSRRGPAGAPGTRAAADTSCSTGTGWVRCDRGVAPRRGHDLAGSSSSTMPSPPGPPTHLRGNSRTRQGDGHRPAGWSARWPGPGSPAGGSASAARTTATARGSGIGLNSYLVGLSGSPVTYYAPTPLLITAEGGSFASGTIRLAIHLLQIEPPRRGLRLRHSCPVP